MNIIFNCILLIAMYKKYSTKNILRGIYADAFLTRHKA